MQEKNCVVCGTDMGVVHHSTKYCSTCRPERQRHGAPVRVRSCVDCGCAFFVTGGRHKRCSDCRAVRTQIYHAIRGLRAAIANKAIANPDDAIRFVQDMVQEDGAKFTNWAIDGVVERIIVDERTHGVNE
jgi:hypothetical protein